jgi:glycerophosphoryl diester phosphodiesterase
MNGKIISVVLAIVLCAMVQSGCRVADSGKSAESAGMHVICPRSAEELRRLFGYNGEPTGFVSAHRGGGGAGYPENCIATFEHTLRQVYAIMEIDPRYTKDGEIVVHHDASLARTTTGKGPVAEMTLRQLRELRLKDRNGAVTDYQIPTLDEVLEWARGRTVVILDQKDVDIEARVRKIEEHEAEAFAMVIVYSLKDARRCYELNRDIMMEVMIADRESFRRFDETGIPWGNIIAFTGHTQPKDEGLLEMIHAKGTCCVAGTSRNLDKELAGDRESGNAGVEQSYRELLERGVDLIETDIPVEVGKLVYGEASIGASRAGVLQRRQF